MAQTELVLKGSYGSNYDAVEDFLIQNAQFIGSSLEIFGSVKFVKTFDSDGKLIKIEIMCPYENHTQIHLGL